MERKHCLACQKQTDHGETATGFACIDCGNEFEQGYFELCDSGSFSDRIDPDNGQVCRITCSKCGYEMDNHEDFAGDPDTGIRLCHFCWENVTGDWQLPLPKTAQRMAELVKWVHSPISFGKGNGN